VPFAVPVPMNQAVVFPDLKAGADRWTVDSLDRGYGFVIRLVFDALRQIDVVAMIEKMNVIFRHLFKLLDTWSHTVDADQDGRNHFLMNYWGRMLWNDGEGGHAERVQLARTK
jgi:hypothetical protein